MVLQDGFIRTEGGMGLLWYTKEKFGDCVIRVVYKTGSKAGEFGDLHPDRRQAEGPLVRGPSRLRGPDQRQR